MSKSHEITIDELNGILAEKPVNTEASELLQALEKAGYVVVRKNNTPVYDPRKNPFHEPSDYNTRQ